MVRVVRSSSNPALHDFLLSWGVGSVDAALFVRRVRGGRCRNLGSDHPGDILGSSMRVAGARRGAKGLAGSTVARLPARADSRRRRTHHEQRMHPAEDAYRRYRYRIYRFFLVRTGSHHDAEDLTQRVFVDALTALSSTDTTPDSVLRSGCTPSRSAGSSTNIDVEDAPSTTPFPMSRLEADLRRRRQQLTRHRARHADARAADGRRPQAPPRPELPRDRRPDRGLGGRPARCASHGRWARFASRFMSGHRRRSFRPPTSEHPDCA